MDDDLMQELVGVSTSDMGNAQEADHVVVHDKLLATEIAVLETQTDNVPVSDDTDLSDVLQLGTLLCQGKYADVLRSTTGVRILESIANSGSGASDSTHITQVMQEQLGRVLSSSETPLVEAYRMLYVGIALLNLYVQANYTGPALASSDLTDVQTRCYHVLTSDSSAFDENKVHADALLWLQVDGESPFSVCDYPIFLLLGRSLLDAVGNPRHASWACPPSVFDGSDGEELPAYTKHSEEVVDVLDTIPSASWWSGRAAVAHERLLLTRSSSRTLWMEAKRAYVQTLSRPQLFAKTRGEYLKARAQVEYGLAQHYFDKNKQGKRSFEEAKVTTGLSVQLSGSMGKRTKFQRDSKSQMVLLASSKHAPEASSAYAEAEAASTHRDFGGRMEEETKELGEGELTAKEKKIQKMVQEGKATYRDIELDQVDPDNILLENVAFEDESLTQQGNLHVMDQVVLLALCLDVKNSSAQDGLTREEMFPYVTRVLENPNNWMVYSTALLERAWLECESSKRRERAILQMQALVDQHSTRLTVTQSSLEAIQDSAPANERMAYVYSLAFPPQYALKKDLAERYMHLGVLGSAVEICKELEMWDDLVQCYQAMDKPAAAEKLVRERLQVAPTPYMYCCLGDVTDDPTCYEKAWELSKHRFARAKRSLGRRAFESGEQEDAIKHYLESAGVNPTDTKSWFMLGVLGMRTQQWKLSLQSFTRVVQLEPDNGEALGNLGSVHMTLGQYAQAFSMLSEALKQKRHLWQMWENYAACAMEVGKLGEAMYAMHQLLDMREKHKRPIDHEVLAWLVESIVFPKALSEALNEREEQVEDEDTANMTRIGSDSEEELDDLDERSQAQDKTPPLSNDNYKKQLALLFGRITSIVTTDAKVWQVYARFNDGVGRPDKALDCRLKQCRALQTANWERDEGQVQDVCRAVERLAQDYVSEGSKKSLYSCKLYMRGVLRKAQQDFGTLESVRSLQETMDRVTSMHQEL